MKDGGFFWTCSAGILFGVAAWLSADKRDGVLRACGTIVFILTVIAIAVRAFLNH